MKRLKPYFEHSDERGTIRGVVQNDPSLEINYITSKKGVMRGNHYHKETSEKFFIISGNVSVDIENLKTSERTRFTAAAGDIFSIEPYEFHTFTILEDATWINILSKAIDGKNPDIHRR